MAHSIKFQLDEGESVELSNSGQLMVILHWFGFVVMML